MLFSNLLPFSSLNFSKNFSTNKSNFYTSNKSWLFTGLTDAEGYFTADINRSSTSKLGFAFGLRFGLLMHKRDYDLLCSFREYLGNIGNVRLVTNKNFVTFNVTSISELKVVINHFDKFPLVTSKSLAFHTFKLIHNIISNKQHLTESGFMLICSYINILNKPLSSKKHDEITNKFGNLLNIYQPGYVLGKVNASWLIGFFVGEGSLTYSRRSTSPNSPTLFAEIGQSRKDLFVLEAIKDFLGYGVIHHEIQRDISKIRFSTHSNLPDFVNFLQKYGLTGFKLKQFNVWIQAYNLLRTMPKSPIRDAKLSSILNELAEIRKFY